MRDEFTEPPIESWSIQKWIHLRNQQRLGSFAQWNDGVRSFVLNLVIAVAMVISNIGGHLLNVILNLLQDSLKHFAIR